jgi:hypothetical protein
MENRWNMYRPSVETCRLPVVYLVDQTKNEQTMITTTTARDTGSQFSSIADRIIADEVQQLRVLKGCLEEMLFQLPVRLIVDIAKSSCRKPLISMT